jgi:hypothetical protein
LFVGYIATKHKAETTEKKSKQGWINNEEFVSSLKIILFSVDDDRSQYGKKAEA